jgi:hypothetical protein
MNRSIFFQSNNVTVYTGFATNLDYTTRCVAVLIHLIYFAFICNLSEYRSRTMLYLHHVNIVSMLYCVHFVMYIGSRAPSFDDDALNETLCTMSELAWMNLKLMRALSLLLLAAYRYIAVYHMSAYRRLNGSLPLLVALVPLSWLGSVCASLTLKYAFQTSYSPFFCTDGYSQLFALAISYYAVSVLIDNVMPTLIVFFIYRRIQSKFHRLTSELKNADASNPARKSEHEISAIKRFNISAELKLKLSLFNKTNHLGSKVATINNLPLGVNDPNSKTSSSGRNQFKFAKQMAIINFLMIMSSLFLLVTNFQVILASYPQYASLDRSLSLLRPLIRMFFFLFQSMIPIVCIAFNPDSNQLVRQRLQKLTQAFRLPKSSSTKTQIQIFIQPASVISPNHIDSLK